ncbi:hypothetical protein OWC48_45765 [Bradyrhizobium sp. Arg816]|nr:hypothetical protein [Bradyrhizobium sp. Arg816]
MWGLSTEERAWYRSASPAWIVIIGRNCHGNWFARAQNGIFGGLFVSRAQAFKCPLFQNGYHPESIVEVSSEIELDISAPA